MIRRAAIAATALLLLIVSARADAAFQQWLQATWPQAQELGVSRATFDAATRGLEPDLSLPDLALPGRPEQQPQQPEFVQTPAQYLREPTFDRLAAQGKKLAAQYRDTLARIEKAVRRARQRRAGDLGARDRLRRLQAAARRHPHAGDAGLCRQAQGIFPKRIPARAENAAGRRAARRTCARPGAAPWASPSSCRRSTTNTPSISTATAAPTSGIRCRTRWPRRPSNSPARAGRPASPGRSRCACRQTSIAPSRSRAT